MEAAKQFTSSIGFVVFFLVVLLFMSMALGDGPTTAFLWLVLLGMIVVNADKITQLMGRFSTV